MKSILSAVLITSMLVMSVDGAADSAIKGHPHGDALWFSPTVTTDAATASNASSDSDHCEHCCHGHSNPVSAQVPSTIAFSSGDVNSIAVTVHLYNFAQAPPTPPPIV